jgi:hypothetical protein
MGPDGASVGATDYMFQRVGLRGLGAERQVGCAARTLGCLVRQGPDLPQPFINTAALRVRCPSQVQC